MELTTTILHAKRGDAVCDLRVRAFCFEEACEEQSPNFRSGRSIGPWAVAGPLHPRVSGTQSALLRQCCRPGRSAWTRRDAGKGTISIASAHY